MKIRFPLTTATAPLALSLLFSLIFVNLAFAQDSAIFMPVSTENAQLQGTYTTQESTGSAPEAIAPLPEPALATDSEVVPPDGEPVEEVPVEEVVEPSAVEVPPEDTGFKIPWEAVALVISILSGLAAVTGFSLNAQKRKRAISKYMEEIDKTFHEFKWKAKRCEAELYRLHDLAGDRLKKGKIDEPQFEILTKRIEKYTREIQENPHLNSLGPS